MAAVDSRLSDNPTQHREPSGRRILLCVCGGIAAYKAVELVRRLRDGGDEVQVVVRSGRPKAVRK